MKRLIHQLDELNDILLQMKAELAESVRELRAPNSDITPVGNGNIRVFTMQASMLSGGCVLSPFYYDYDAQYDAVLEKLHSQRLDVFANTLEGIMRTGKLDGQRMHPEVIKRLSTLLEE